MQGKTTKNQTCACLLGIQVVATDILSSQSCKTLGVVCQVVCFHSQRVDADYCDIAVLWLDFSMQHAVKPNPGLGLADSAKKGRRCLGGVFRGFRGFRGCLGGVFRRGVSKFNRMPDR